MLRSHGSATLMSSPPPSLPPPVAGSEDAALEPNADAADALAEPSAAGWTIIGPYGSDRGLREASLVLRSMDVPHETTWGVGGGYLAVRDAHYGRARSVLDRYAEENRNFPPQRRAERSRYMGVPLVAALFLAFVAFAAITGPLAHPNGGWFARGASVSSLVLSSQPFRAVTALTLHADGAHVLSNLVSGAIFGRALERRFGPGVAALSIIAAGTIGNVGNALFFAAQGLEHRSIGASTAVFGAIGLLASSQLILGAARTSSGASGRRHWTEYLAPIIGGIALLGALGSGPETDIFAHLFGLVGGFALGVPTAFALKKWHSRYVWGRGQVVAQVACFTLAIGALVGSWAIALA